MMNFASLVNLYSQRMPRSAVARLASTLGPEGAARILQSFSGEIPLCSSEKLSLPLCDALHSQDGDERVEAEDP